MPTFKLTLAYDGTQYAGWQRQTHAVTLQGALEQAIEQVVGQPVTVSASGRTDAGVHALGQVVSFACETRLDAATIQRALNAYLPDDMAVVAAAEMNDGFHALRRCTGKRYRYVLVDGPLRDVFRLRYAWHVRGHRLNATAMHQAAQELLGTHDFSSFQTQGSPRESTVRTVRHIEVVRLPAPDAHVLHVEIEADGFLYHMVRSIVGTLVDVGRQEQLEPGWLAQVLASGDRCQAGKTAPAQGLFLLWASYEPQTAAAPPAERAPADADQE